MWVVKTAIVGESPIKILYAHNGDSVYDEMFVRFLVERGHEVHFFTILNATRLPKWQQERYCKTLDIPGLRVHSRPSDHWNPAIVAPVLRMLLQRIKPDVLVGNSLQSYAFFSSLSNYHPFVAVVWGSDVLIAPKSIVGRMRAILTLACADHVVVDSVVQAQATMHLGCNPSKIVSFPWCVDLDEFNPLLKFDELRRDLGYTTKDFIVLCNRQHESIYGLEYLFRAIPCVLQRIPTCRFLILGQGSLTNQLKGLVKELGVEAQVRFEGNVIHEMMPKYISISDAYVSPSLSDGTSASLLEAMACQKPVIATEIAGNLEWVRTGESGILVPPRNSSAIADAIVTLAIDPALAKSCGREALRIARRRANLKLSLAKFEALLYEASDCDRRRH
jgi:glycosyltransferase involved in cell wall biosynthesis